MVVIFISHYFYLFPELKTGKMNEDFVHYKVKVG